MSDNTRSNRYPPEWFVPVRVNPGKLVDEMGDVELCDALWPLLRQFVDRRRVTPNEASVRTNARTAECVCVAGRSRFCEAHP